MINQNNTKQTLPLREKCQSNDLTLTTSEAIAGNGKVTTQLHSPYILSSSFPTISTSSNSISLNHVSIPSNRSIKILLDLNYSKLNTLKEDPRIMGICIWILICVHTMDLHISDSKISELTGVKAKKVSTAKLALLDAEYITTTVVTKNNLKGSQYFKGNNWCKLSFTESVGNPIIVSLPKKKKRKLSKKTNKRNFKETKFTRPLNQDTVTKIHNKYYFNVATEIYLPSDEHITTLLNSKCGSKLVKENPDRIRACATIIDLIRSEYYNEIDTHNVPELETFQLGEEEIIIYDDSDEYYRFISQAKFLEEISNRLATTYNTDGLSAAKETLEELGWIKVKESRNRTKKDTRGNNQRYAAPNLKDPESKRYKLAEKFYDNNLNSRSSKLSLPISKKVSTPYRGLAMAELDPEIFKNFEFLAKKIRQNKNKKEWDETTKSYQLSTLQNFDYLRGYSNKKQYNTVTNSRIYTSISRMPELFRNYILIDGEETVEIDIKSAHAVFITLEMEDKEEIKRWLDLINGNYESKIEGKKDIYYYFIDTLGIHPDSVKQYPTRDDQRKQCKIVLSAYYNGASSQKKMDKKLKFKTPIFSYLKKEFPDLDKTIRRILKHYRCSGMDGSALRLQEIESDVMGTYFMENPNYTCISIHDGLRVKKSEAQMFIDAVKKRAKDRYGLDIIVEEK